MAVNAQLDPELDIVSRPSVWVVGGDDVRMRLPLLAELTERGFDVGAIGSEDPEIFAEHGVAYRRYSLERGVSPLCDRRSRDQLFRIFDEVRPDIVHAFDTKPVIIAPLAAERAGIRGTVCTITGLGYVFSSNSFLPLALRPAFHILNRRALRKTTVTVFQNTDDRDYFLKSGILEPGRDALVRSSGIDVERIRAARPDAAAAADLRRELGLEGRLVVTMVGRLAVHKGVREFLESATRVRQELSDAAFVLIGPLASEGRLGVSRQELEHKADDVLYLGERSDIAALLSISDVFVLPSYNREGVPRVLLEAGAFELPLITTDMPGCRDVVRDGWNGLLIPPKDAPALTQAILRLLRSNEERQEMGRRSYSHVVDTFSLERVADAYAEVYRRVLAVNRSCAAISATTTQTCR